MVKHVIEQWVTIDFLCSLFSVLTVLSSTQPKGSFEGKDCDGSALLQNSTSVLQFSTVIPHSEQAAKIHLTTPQPAVVWLKHATSGQWK